MNELSKSILKVSADIDQLKSIIIYLKKDDLLKRSQRLMKLTELVSVIQKKYRPYSAAKELVLERHNILEQDFSKT